MHRWLWWLPRDSADTGRYGRWRRWLRTARCDGGVARPLHAEDHSPPPRGRKRGVRAIVRSARRRPSDLPQVEPELALQVCEKAVALAGADLGDIRTARRMMGQPVMRVVMAVYRRGDATLRESCQPAS